MALLERPETRQTVLVEPELVIGRQPTCGLRLAATYVSSLHATLRWDEPQWELKDLGSRNGTWLNGERLAPGQAYPVTRGARMAFGSEQEAWTLVDDSPPRPMVVPLDGGAPVVLEDDVVGLPSDENPEVTLMRDNTGLWRVERMDGEVIALENRGIIEIAGKSWRVAFGDGVGATSVIAATPEHAAISLRFKVSPDEEHVELSVEHAGRSFALGCRGHNYLLLTLARLRLADAKSGTRNSACGWTYVDDLEKSLKLTPARINLDIFRIRQQFSRLDFGRTVNIIERRSRVKQLRIGADTISIETI